VPRRPARDATSHPNPVTGVLEQVRSSVLFDASSRSEVPWLPGHRAARRPRRPVGPHGSSPSGSRLSYLTPLPLELRIPQECLGVGFLRSRSQATRAVNKTAILLTTAEARKEIDSPPMTEARVKKPYVCFIAAGRFRDRLTGRWRSQGQRDGANSDLGGEPADMRHRPGRAGTLNR